MADQFVQDLAALDERSRTHLRSLAATRAHVLSAPPETKMRFIKNRPLLALLLLLAFVGAASGAAYAVDKIWLSVDPEKSAPEIEQDVKSQLDQAGVAADVHVDKTDGRIEMRIMTTDPDLPQKLGYQGSNGGIAIGSEQRRIGVDDRANLGPAQSMQLANVLASSEVITALQGGDAIAVMQRALANAGFTDVEVTAVGPDYVVTVKSPPTK